MKKLDAFTPDVGSVANELPDELPYAVKRHDRQNAAVHGDGKPSGSAEFAGECSGLQLAVKLQPIVKLKGAGHMVSNPPARLIVAGLAISWLAGLAAARDMGVPASQTAGIDDTAAYIDALQTEIARLRSMLGTVDRPCQTFSCHFQPGWLASVDYLNWKARRDDLDFATFDPGDLDIPQGRIVGLSFSRDSGVRADVGYRMIGGWTIGLSYTYFHSAVNRTVSVPPGSNELTPILSSPYGAALVDVDQSSASASLDYDVFDFNIGRQLRVAEALPVHLYGGFRWAMVDQDFDVSYEGNDTDVGADGYSVSAPIHCDGYGIRFGGEAEWILGSGFHVMGKSTVSILSGDFSSRYVLLDGDRDQFDANISNHFSRLVPVLELACGVGWQRGPLGIQGGYEFANWFNLVEEYEFPNDTDPPKLASNARDLGLEGFFVRATWTW